MNQLLGEAQRRPELDPLGSLVDADLVNRPGTNVAVAARRLEVLLHDETCPVP